MTGWTDDLETVSFFMQAALVLLGLHLSVLAGLLARWLFERVAVARPPESAPETGEAPERVLPKAA
ncbi:hypothetical protein [Noviherbaspirillum aridicola]|uniref:Uncharacterized protein n=1 Tax=Noviherbaspirillum aridicola TaxID=2849687 RepID=A0ABQ4Q469_9BURK|nr:hypothetical protein [Noviherbaspirillum aridicola]GIZ51991.1 hypothetical protein NCCP691_20050 [Noviherbaspirillum aridicola]